MECYHGVISFDHGLEGDLRRGSALEFYGRAWLRGSHILFEDEGHNAGLEAVADLDRLRQMASG